MEKTLSCRIPSLSKKYSRTALVALSARRSSLNKTGSTYWSVKSVLPNSVLCAARSLLQVSSTLKTPTATTETKPIKLIKQAINLFLKAIPENKLLFKPSQN